MFATPTINRYLIKSFSSYFLVTTLVVVALLLISSSFDILQKFKSANITPLIFWQLVSYKVPHLFNETSSLIGFISTILFLNRLSVNNELIILSASSLQFWRIYVIPVFVTLFFGALLLVVVTPISTYGLIEYERLEGIVTDKPESKLVVSQSGIFFYEKFDNSHRIIEAGSINALKKELTELTILIVDSDNNFLQRLDSDRAILDNGNFILNKPTIVDRRDMFKQESIILPTQLTVESLVQRFTSPELILIWNLPSAIEKFSKSGIATTNYELYYYKQLLKPIVMAAMVLLACWFISSNNRDNKNTRTIIYGLIIGIAAFFSIEISSRFLAIGGFDPFFACLLPALAIILISNFVILHFQEA